jgi:polyphenol oxidase
MIKGDASEKSPGILDRSRRRRSKCQPRLRAAASLAMTLPRPDAAFDWQHEPWGAALRCRALASHAQHLFTSKQLALPEPESWRQALSSVGATPERLMRVKQVHGSNVRVLARPGIGPGANDAPPDAIPQRTERAAEIPEADAIASNQPGLVLAVMVADCVPILIVDPVRGAAAAIHAGWRGTCARVAVATIATMSQRFDSNPAELIAAIGPSVGPEDYEVGESVFHAFEEAGHTAGDLNRWFLRSFAKPHLDLWRANADQLIASGLGAERVFTCGLSTVSHPDVFDSYRVAGERAGRMAGLVVVPTAA